MSPPPFIPKMKAVDRQTYFDYIERFPDRSSSRTGICEPPQEQCILDGVGMEWIGAIGLALLGYVLMVLWMAL